MLDKTIVDNRRGRNYQLYLKVFTLKPSVPTGTHYYLASGKNGKWCVLITEHNGQPYLFAMSEDLFQKLDIDPLDGFRLCFIIKNTEGLPATMRKRHALDTVVNEEIDMTSMRLHALETLGRKGYASRPLDSRHPSQTVALRSTGQDPFIVLNDTGGSGDYLILFVPMAFTHTTEWTLAEAKPWDFELTISSERHLYIPFIFRKK